MKEKEGRKYKTVAHNDSNWLQYTHTHSVYIIENGGENTKEKEGRKYKTVAHNDSNWLQYTHTHSVYIIENGGEKT